MRRGRGTALAIALLGGAVVAAAGCGLGSGRQLGSIALTVTRDYGAAPVVPRVAVPVSESDTVMRALERKADIATRYGGGFVQSIAGIAGAERGGRRYDWFFYVDGVESTRGAADVQLRGGEAVWWDYRDWSAALSVPAVVGSWPRPLRGGYDGRPRPVALECLGGRGACAEARLRLERAGVSLAPGEPRGAIRVLVGPWSRVRRDAAAAQIESGPQQSGVFADFVRRRGGAFELRGLREDGGVGRAFGPGAGIVAATRRYDGPPVWVVSGVTAPGVRIAARLLDEADLRDRYAVVAEGGRKTPLPLPAR